MLLVHLFVCFVRVSFPSWCRGLAAVCDCVTPLTFLLTCFKPALTADKTVTFDTEC